MSKHADSIRLQLSGGPRSARQLAESIEVSQPTISRALSSLETEVIRFGTAPSIQYALRDSHRLPDIPVYRVNADGQIKKLGTLIPVRPDGFVMVQEDGVTLHSDGPPWWLLDMRPQGYLGRAYAARHGPGLGLPERLTDWSDTHAFRALLAHGHDVVGNLLLGGQARARFLDTRLPEPVPLALKADAYVPLAQEAAKGEIPGSSAGGEQPKFAAYTTTPDGNRHVLVKFSEAASGVVGERWRDLLLAEHLALSTLREAGIAAATTHVIDRENQRFLEIERFDRIGSLGRRALMSLASLNAEFVGIESGGWPVVTHRLATDGLIQPEAADAADLLWAFGTLIGNTDMHSGNLSFISEHGRPYDIAPAYDMTPMAFAPRTGGGLPDAIPDANIHPLIANETWRKAEILAREFLARISSSNMFSQRFDSCIDAIRQHIETASVKIGRLE